MLPPSLHIILTFSASLPTLCYCQMLWTYIAGGKTWNTGVRKPDFNYPWPGSRSKASTWQDKNGELWMFGGSGFNTDEKLEYLNDLWFFNTPDKRWYVIQPLSKPQPPNRASASVCGVSGIMLVVYGGSGGDNLVYGDTWVYVIANNTWFPLKTQSAPQSRSEAATWCTNTHMFVFGGRNNQTVLADMWEFSLKDLTWTNVLSDHNTSVLTQLTVPSSRTGAFTWVIKNQKRNSLYMFGGDVSDSVYTSEMWEFSLTAKNWSLLFGGDNFADSPRYKNYTLYGCKSGVSWSDNDNLWLYGGEILLPYNNNKAFKGDVWRYNTELCRWYWAGQKRTSEEKRKLGTCFYHDTPGARSGAVGWLYDNKFYMFGGEIHNEDQLKYTNDLWYMALPSGPMTVSVWIPILIIFVGLFLIAILVAVGLYSRRLNGHERGTSYSLVANSDIFDS